MVYDAHISMTPPTPPGLPPQVPQQYPQPPLPPAPKSDALKWVLISVGVLVLVLAAIVAAGTFFVYRTVRNAGFDPDLMRSNPGLAMARMAAALHPDLEIVSTDDDTGTIVMREKSTGKTTTFKFDPDKKTLVMAGEDGKQVKIAANGDGKNGTLEVQGPDGVTEFGASAGNTTPAWVPVYPGSSPQGTASTQTSEGTQNTYVFKTKDAAGKVLAYYQERLKGSGFTVNMAASGAQGSVLQAVDGAQKRSLLITVGPSEDGGAQGSITAIEKK
jgi:hypothetical protein